MHQTSNGGLSLPQPSIAGRNVAKRSKRHFVGHIVGNDGAVPGTGNFGVSPGRVIQTESDLEKKTALILHARPDTALLEEQVRFEYGDGQVHFFDFRLTRTDGRCIAISVKMTKYLAKHLEEMRPIAAEVQPDFADAVHIWTERNVDPVELYNAKLFHATREADPEADIAAETVVAPLLGAVPIQDLTDRIGLGARGFRALVRLIAQDRLCPIRLERITPASLVRRKETQQ